MPARSLQINNATANTLASLDVSGEGKAARLAKPLGPKKKTTLKLPALKTCAVSVTSTFEGGQPDTNDFDICKEKSIRFTE